MLVIFFIIEDLFGNVLADAMDLDTPLQNLSMTIMANQGLGWVSFNWEKMSNRNVSILLDQLVSTESTRLISAIIKLAVPNSDNIVISQEWWDNLPETHKNVFMDGVKYGTPVGSTHSPFIHDGINFDEWGLDNMVLPGFPWVAPIRSLPDRDPSRRRRSK
jgi:hypothetical protein